MKYFFISIILIFTITATAKTKIRIAFANEDFGNWHFCGDKNNHKTSCNPGDVIKGFNPEIAQEIFKRLNKKYDVIFAEWADDTFFEGLVNNKYDVIISNVAQKESRKKYGIFSAVPYEPLDESGDYFFYVMKGAEVSLTSVGTQAGSIQENYLKNIFRPGIIQTYTSTQNLITSLTSGQTKAILGSFSTIKTALCAKPNIVRFSSTPISLDQKGVDDRTYVFTTKRMSKLASQIDRILKTMHNDGTVRSLFDKWLKKSFECE